MSDLIPAECSAPRVKGVWIRKFSSLEYKEAFKKKVEKERGKNSDHTLTLDQCQELLGDFLGGKEALDQARLLLDYKRSMTPEKVKAFIDEVAEEEKKEEAASSSQAPLAESVEESDSEEGSVEPPDLREDAKAAPAPAPPNQKGTQGKENPVKNSSPAPPSKSKEKSPSPPPVKVIDPPSDIEDQEEREEGEQEGGYVTKEVKKGDTAGGLVKEALSEEGLPADPHIRLKLREMEGMRENQEILSDPRIAKVAEAKGVDPGDLQPFSVIFPGQVLSIPKGKGDTVCTGKESAHIVMPGQTLSTIAKVHLKANRKKATRAAIKEMVERIYNQNEDAITSDPAREKWIAKHGSIEDSKKYDVIFTGTRLEMPDMDG